MILLNIPLDLYLSKIVYPIEIILTITAGKQYSDPARLVSADLHSVTLI